MNSENNDYRDKLLMKFLDGDTTPEEEREALHMIADDEGMREMLRFERSLNRTFSNYPAESTTEIPENFADLVMESIEDMNHHGQSAKTENKSILDQFLNPLKSLLKSDIPQFRPVLGYAVALIIVAMAGYYLGIQTQGEEVTSTASGMEMELASEENEVMSVWIRFIYIDDSADEMAVAGDFSNWEPIPLDRQTVDGQQVWSGLIEITRGEHKYMFLKNGETWLTDPLADVTRDDGFGNKNAVIVL